MSLSFRSLSLKDEEDREIPRERCSNPFDYEHDEDPEQNNVFGITPTDADYRIAHDFLKKSMQAANMVFDSIDSSSNTKISAEDSEYAGMKKLQAVSDSTQSQSKQSRPVPKYSSEDLIDTTRMKPRSDSRSIPASEVRMKLDITQGNLDLSDVVNIEPQISASQFNALKEELRQAKQTIEQLKSERWSAAPPRDIVKRIVAGKPYSLDAYRSLSQKTELLDAALMSRDGNAIVAVILFLQRTLEMFALGKELRKRPMAVAHYACYLRSIKDWDTLENLYKYLLRIEDAAMLRFEVACKSHGLSKRLSLLKEWIGIYGQLPEMSDMRSCVETEIRLLETQSQIEEEAGRKGLKVATLPIVTTVHLCAYFDFDKPSSPHHPQKLKQKFQLSEKQYEWAVLPALSKLHKWTDLQELLTSKGLLGKKSPFSNIGFDKVADILYKSQAPSEILNQYLFHISNCDLRLKIAARFHAHDVVIDTIVQLKDRRKLEDYRLKVGQETSYRQKINDALVSSDIKWR